MKIKLIAFGLFIVMSACLYAQSNEQLEALQKIESEYELVENGTKVRYSKIYEDLGKSREDLLEGLTNFFRFREGYQLNGDFDVKDVNDTYVVTFSLNYGNVGGRASLGHDYSHYLVSNWRIDIKENRVRAIVDLSDYTQVHLNKTGILVKEYKNAVPLVAVAPFKKVKKEKDNEMYAACFIRTYVKTRDLFYYLGESFKMIVKKAPDASTDW